MLPSAGRLFGRQTELTRLSAVAGIETGQPAGMVVLGGDAGIGKSRLAAELAATAAKGGWLTLTVHCVGLSGTTMAYLPFLELISRAEALVPQVVDAVAQRHPALTQLSGAGEPEDAGPTSGRKTMVAEAVYALLVALGAARPTLLIVEDVHWADSSTRELLTVLLTRGFPTALALVVTYRSDDLHRRHPLHETLPIWARSSQVQHLELRPLPDAAVREVIEELPEVRLDQATADTVVERAAGNPFFAEELAVSAASGYGTSGSLSRVLQARVEALGGDAREVSRMVALGSGRTSHELLRLLLELPDDRLRSAIDEAVDRHVLVADEHGYDLRHSVLAETIADSLLPGERRRLHRRFAHVLSGNAGLAPDAELARHAAASGDRLTAVAASRRAAAHAMAVGGPSDALAHLERALDLTSEDEPERNLLILKAAEAAWAAGDPLRCTRLLRDGLEHPVSDQDPALEAELLAAYVTAMRVLDLPFDGLAMTTRALDLVGGGNDEVLLRVRVAHVQQLVDARRLREAVAWGDEAIALAERLGRRRELTEVRVILTRVVEELDDLDAAEEYLAHVLSKIPPDDPICIRVHYMRGASRHRRGDLAGALERYREGAQLARRLNREQSPWGLECHVQAALVAYELGHWDEAANLLKRRGLAQPGRAMMDAAGLSVAAGRGIGDADRIRGLREWWPLDTLVAVLTTSFGIDLLAHTGDFDAVLDLAQDANQVIYESWGPSQAAIRIAALVAGQTATCYARIGTSQRQRSGLVLNQLRGHLEAVLGEALDDPTAFGRLSSAFAPTNRESWMWLVRLRAELARLDWEQDAFAGDPAALVALWQDAMDVAADYGHVYETARARVRLAAAQRLAGDETGARATLRLAHDAAAGLGAQPLLIEALAVFPKGVTLSDVAAITPREREVLTLLARGLTNGQIGHRLHISTKTVSVHVSNLLAKLGAAGRTEAAARARERGLVK